MTVVVVVNFYNTPINKFRSTKMSATKEILSIYSENEAVTDLLLNILLSNTSFTEKLQKVAKDFANKVEVAVDE